MKKKYFITIFLLFLIIGCINNGSKDTAKLQRDLYKGTTGISIEFFDNKLTDEVYEGETLNFIVRIDNKGPYEVNNAKYLVTVEPSFMEFDNEDNVYEKTDIHLDGKTIFNTLDDFHIEEIPIQVKELDELSEYHDSLILANFCYDYKGIAIADVCIDTDPQDTRPFEKPCSAQDSISLSGGQGGPVVITRIEPRMLTESSTGESFIRPQFKIYVRNQGRGSVFRYGSVNEVCNKDSLNRHVYNAITFRSIEFSNYNKGDFECFPSELVLRQEEDFMTCTLNTGNIPKDSSTYLTPLTIEIDYGYIESITKEIRINKILKY